MNDELNFVGQVWKQIPGFSKYMVSNMGRVKALPTLISRPSKGQYMRETKILSGTKDGCGYLHVRLLPDDNGKPVLWKIHQLVAYVFLGYKRNNSENIVVDHINSIKTDNSLENLRLMDKVQNHKLGCHIKMLERRMPEEIYWYEKNDVEYNIVINLLLNTKSFVHCITANNKLIHSYISPHRVLYEEAIQEFEQNGAFEKK